MILKNNSINDPQIINKISEASCAGVRVDMIVRGICCIKAGVPGKTENVHIRSIVGRYLEHSRIYCFGEGEDMTIYIASGDFLTRNTERRVEVGVRVDDREIAKSPSRASRRWTARWQCMATSSTALKPHNPPHPPERLPPNRFKRPSTPRPIPTNRKIGVSAVFLTACLATKSNPRKGCSAPFPPDGRDAASAAE